MTDKKLYVCMTDKFFSHMGSKNSKLVIICDTWAEAEIVEENARNRRDQKYININTTPPHYPASYQVIYHDKKDYPTWFKKGAF